MAFGGFGKAIGGAFKGAGKNIKGAMMGGGGGVNAGPSGGFMSRFKSAMPMALNNAAQAFGSPETKQTARMTAGMMRPQAPTQMPGPAMPPMDNTGVAGPPPINTGPSPQIFGGQRPMGMFMPPGLMDKMGGNTGITGGMFPGMRPQPQSPMQGGGEMGMGGGLWDIYNRIAGQQRPQIYT